jgi:hypothetical protein
MHDRTAQKNKIVCFVEEIIRTKVIDPKTVLSSGLGEGVGIWDNIFNDAYRMIRPMISFREIKIGKKCKHLSNFPAVTLRALC